MSEAGPQINGPASPTGKFIDTIDPDDPEYRRNLQRPAEVKEDMKQMEGRSRVSVVLNSQTFREELEQIVAEQIAQGGPASLFALQHISDLLLPHSRAGYSFSTASPAIPVNDIRGVEAYGHTKAEKILRCKLAACYRLVDLFGWTHGIYNHISARLSQEQEQFLVNPFGMLYSEITASTLAKVNMQGEVVDTGSTGLGISKAGFTLHSAIHQARPDIRCIIHLHTPAAVAVSATKKGLIPLSQEALICGQVSYHDYRGILVDQDERDQLARNLGPFNKVMLLRNHGAVACGETIEEAFHYAFNVMAACETQVRAMSAGMENLILVDEETQKKTFRVGSQGGGGTDISGRKWRCGELEWEALMRTLDNAGYRTGHVYKQPLMKQEKKERTNSDVEVPPASSSFTYIFDGDYEHSKYISPIKTALERQKQAYKAGWLTSPNTYKKQEIEEIGTTTPKKITKWIQDGEGGQLKAVKIDNPNLFAPQGANPKEFKEKQKQIKKDYYEEKVTPGPQSRILEGISWDEAARMKEGGDQTIVIGAASKGIIQRDHQHNAVVYRSYYSANPFESMSEAEMDAYKQEVERREQGEEPEDVPGPEGRLISTEERMQQIQRSREDVDKQDTEDEERETKLGSVVNGEPKVEPQVKPQVESQVKPQVEPQVKPQVEPQVKPQVEPQVEVEAKVERSQEVASPPRAEESRQNASTTVATDECPVALKPSPQTLKKEPGFAIPAVLPSALPSSCNKGQHSIVGDERGVGSSTPHRQSSQFFPGVDSLPSEQSGCANQSQHLETTRHAERQAKKRYSKKTEAHSDDPDGESKKESEPLIIEPPVIRIFQGKPDEGVMKIRFTIHSTVTRRKVKGSKGHWPVEQASVLLSQPEVTFADAESKSATSVKNPVQLKENHSVYVVETPEISSEDVPKQSLLQKVSQKRPFHLHGYRTGLFRPHKPHRKSKRLRVRKIVQVPLSPVKEEITEEETLETLLANQNVNVDSDESLEDLLLSPDNIFESSHEMRTTLYDQFHQKESTQQQAVRLKAAPSEEPLFVMPNVGGSQLSYLHKDGHSRPMSFQFRDLHLERGKTIAKNLASGQMCPMPQTTENSGIFPASTKHVNSRLVGDLSKNSVETSGNEELCRKVQSRQSRSVPFDMEHYGKAADTVVLKGCRSSKVRTVHLSRSEPDLNVITREKKMGLTEVTKAVCQEDLSKRVLKIGADPLFIAAPLAELEDLEYADETCPTTSPSLQDEEKPVLCSQGVLGNQVLKTGVDPLMIAASLAEEKDFEYADGSSPISSPPVLNEKLVLGSSDLAFICLSPDFNSPSIINEPEKTMHTDPQRVQNFEYPLPGTSINPFGEQAVLGVAMSWPQSNSTRESQNERVCKAALHSVTTELVQATLPECHESLTSASNDGLASDQQINNMWICGDSKSNKNLELDPLTQAGSENTEKQVSIPSSGDVILKMPMSFSELPPKVKKDFLIDEGPLQTSSPKLGRRQDSGSFKIYQSKMGKSEETLEAVVCLDQQNQLVGGRRLMPRRSKSFPRNLGSIRSRETMLDDTPLQGSNDRETKGASSLHKGVSSEGENSQPIEGNQSIQKVIKNSSADARHVFERALSWSEKSSREKENYPPTTDTANYPLRTKERQGKEEWKEEELLRRRHRRAQKDDDVDDALIGEGTNEKELGLHWSGKKRRRRRRPLSQEHTGVSTEKLGTVDVGVMPVVGQQDDFTKTETSHLHQSTVSSMQRWSDLAKEVSDHQNAYNVIDSLKVTDQQMPEAVEHRDKQTVETGTLSDTNIVPANTSKQTSLVTLESSNINLSANIEQSEVPENNFYVEGETEFPAPPADLELLHFYEESCEKPENVGDKLLSENCNISKPEPVPDKHEQETLGTFFPTTDDPKIQDYSNDFFTIQERKPSKEMKDKESEPIYAKVIPRSERLSSNSNENKSLLVKDLAETSSQQHINSVTKKLFEESTQARAPKLSESELNIMDYDEEDAPRVRRRRKSKQSETAPTEEGKKKNSFQEASFRPLSEGWIKNEREDTSEDAPRMRRRKHKDVVKLRNSDPPVTAQSSQSGKHFRNDTSSLNIPPKLRSSVTEVVPQPQQLGRKVRSQDTLNTQLTAGEEKESPGVPSESPVVKKMLKNVFLCVNPQGHDNAVRKAPKQNSLRETKQPVGDTLPEMTVSLPHSVPPPHLMKLDFVKEPRRGLHSERESTSSSDSLYRDGSFDKSLEMKALVMNLPRDNQRQMSDNYGDGAEDKAYSFNWNKPSDIDKFGVEDNKQRKDDSEQQDISHHGEAGVHVKDWLEVSQKLATGDKLQDVLSDVNTQDPDKAVKKPQFQEEEEEIMPCRIRSVSFTDGYTPTLFHLPSGVQLGDSLTAENFVRVRENRARTHSFGSDIKTGPASMNPLTHEPWRSRARHSHQAGLSQSHHFHRPRSHSHSGVTYSAHSGRRRRSRIPSAGDNHIYQPRPNRVRGFLLSEHPLAAPSEISTSPHTTMLADDNFYSDANSHGYANESSTPVRRTESDRRPEKNPALIRELESRGIGRSKSDRRPRGEDQGEGDKPGSPSKSDPMDSASGGETLEEHSSKEGSPTKEAPSPTKDKKKKKKFRMPSFSKKKKDSKESTI